MNPSAEEVAAGVARAALVELNDAFERIQHCLGQLSDERVWWRPAESLNSIGNLILHLCGNVRQWIVSGVGGAEDHRDRPREFAERAVIPKEELLRELASMIDETQLALSNISAAELLRVRRIQGFEVDAAQAIFHSVAHFRGHTQEIVRMTRCQLGDAYEFAWSPSTPEEGAL